MSSDCTQVHNMLVLFGIIVFVFLVAPILGVLWLRILTRIMEKLRIL